MSSKQPFEVPPEYAELYERAYRRAYAEAAGTEPDLVAFDPPESPHPSAAPPPTVVPAVVPHQSRSLRTEPVPPRPAGHRRKQTAGSRLGNRVGDRWTAAQQARRARVLARADDHGTAYAGSGRVERASASRADASGRRAAGRRRGGAWWTSPIAFVVLVVLVLVLLGAAAAALGRAVFGRDPEGLGVALALVSHLPTG